LIFDEGSGTVAKDSSGNGNDGTMRAPGVTPVEPSGDLVVTWATLKSR